MQSAFRRIRRNHALEHATLAVLAGSGTSGLLAGYSTAGGFWLMAPVAGSVVNEAAQTALTRLSAGESQLAISRSCGTNFAVAALLASAALRMVESVGGKGRSGWPLSAGLVLGAVLLSRPLGGAIQRGITTLARMDGMRILEVKSFRIGRLQIHRVFTLQP